MGAERRDDRDAGTQRPGTDLAGDAPRVRREVPDGGELPPRPGEHLHVAYRAVLLAGALVLGGLLFKELVTLVLAVIVTIVLAIPLAAFTSRLERRRVPRVLGALLGVLIAAGVLAGILALLLPTLIDEVQRFVDEVPSLVASLQERLSDITGASDAEVGRRVQRFLQGYLDEPVRIIGRVAAIGASVAGVIAVLVVIVMTAYYIAVNPGPLVGSALRLAPPARRAHVERVLDRVRNAWIGWLKGVAVDMVISGTLLYIGLTIIGLDFALVFAVLTALLVVIPYFGSILGAIPPVLLGLTESPGRALVVLGVYVLVQQIEGNVIVPLVMARTVRLHPAAIAIGVVVVGQLFGFVGLFIAVPILSLIAIVVEELWMRPLEATDRERMVERTRRRRRGRWARGGAESTSADAER